MSRYGVFPALVLLRSEGVKLVGPLGVSPSAVRRIGVARVLGVFAQRLDGHRQRYVCSASAWDDVGFASCCRGYAGTNPWPTLVHGGPARSRVARKRWALATEPHEHGAFSGFDSRHLHMALPQQTRGVEPILACDAGSAENWRGTPFRSGVARKCGAVVAESRARAARVDGFPATSAASGPVNPG